jgi:hypothetical protein
LDNTKRNVDYEDNRNVAKILEGYIGLRTQIDYDFERFMLKYIGGMTYEVTRAFSAPLAWAVGNETKRLQTFLGPRNLSDIRESQFDFLFDSVKFLIDVEVQVISRKIKENPEAKSCWMGAVEVLNELVDDIGKKIDTIFKVSARDSRKDFVEVGRSMEQLAHMIQGNYGHKCINEDYVDAMKRCIWESVSWKQGSI